METWRRAWEQANRLFYTADSPRNHFRTNTSYADIMGPVLLRLLDDTTGRGPVQIVDVGGGDGTLLRAIQQAWVDTGQDPASIDCTLLDLRPSSDERHATVIADARESLQYVFPDGINGLLIAHEWLDDLACEVIEVDEEGQRRLVLVDPETGAETFGPALTDPSAQREFAVDPRCIAWLDRWWPISATGARAEVGVTRDDAWLLCTQTITSGTAVMVDYALGTGARPRRGTLSAYRDGQHVAPVPDGKSNITAHVCVDSLMELTSGRTTRLRTQRTALSNVPLPTAPLDRLQANGRLATLRAPHGLGAFAWLEYRPRTTAGRATMSP